MGNPIQNRNLLSPTGFNFIILKAREIDFFSQAASIPQISMNTATQATSLRNVSVPGDELYYGDFTLRFMVDEDMTNYLAIHNWIRSLGFPVNHEEYNFEEKDALYRKKKFTDDMVTNLRLKESGSLNMNFETSDGRHADTARYEGVIRLNKERKKERRTTTHRRSHDAQGIVLVRPQCRKFW